MKEPNRTDRIIARGEFSDHCHVVTGDAKIIRNPNGEIIIEVGNEGAVLKHILETAWIEGREEWTGEHKDINLCDPIVEVGDYVRHGDVGLKKVSEGKFKYVHQTVFDPLTKRIEKARD